MAKWARFPYTGAFHHTAATLKKHWRRLHANDCEPLPTDPDALAAWVLFHNGEFNAAVEAGLSAGPSGINAANKACCIYAVYLEPKEQKRQDIFMEVAARAQKLQQDEPDNVNAWYWQAYALGRYSQDISVAKALAEGLGTRVRKALDTTLKLAPKHAGAHLALAAFHAEVIDKVGTLIGGLTYGAKKETGLYHYQTALALNPHSAIAMVEYANGLVMLEGERRMQEATALYQRAARLTPADAMEQLDIDMARAELASGEST
jgi:tetratricopeptide (TPR) repeat protein